MWRIKPKYSHWRENHEAAPPNEVHELKQWHVHVQQWCKICCAILYQFTYNYQNEYFFHDWYIQKRNRKQLRTCMLWYFNQPVPVTSIHFKYIPTSVFHSGPPTNPKWLARDRCVWAVLLHRYKEAIFLNLHLWVLNFTICLTYLHTIFF